MQGNTTALISAWTMEDTGEDLDGRFHSFVDINRMVAEQVCPAAEAPGTEAPAAELLVKGAGDDAWQALPVDARNTA